MYKNVCAVFSQRVTNIMGDIDKKHFNICYIIKHVYNNMILTVTANRYI